MAHALGLDLAFALRSRSRTTFSSGRHLRAGWRCGGVADRRGAGLWLEQWVTAGGSGGVGSGDAGGRRGQTGDATVAGSEARSRGYERD